MRHVPDPARYPLPLPWRKLRRWIIGGVLLVVGGVACLPLVVTRTRCGVPPEFEAMWTLREVVSAQGQFAAICRVDADRDGKGEYGGLLELAGGAPIRGGTAVVPSPLLRGEFRALAADGSAQRGRYVYRMFLAARDGGVVREVPATRFAVDAEAPVNPCAGPRRIPLDGGFQAAAVDANAAEQMWVCYAWPAAGVSGRTFVVTESGDLFATAAGAYAGAAGPAPGAALDLGGIETIGGTPEDGVPAQDGNVWTKVN